MKESKSRKVVAIASANSWAAPNRMMERHLAERLAAFAPVIHVDPPVSVLNRLHRRPGFTPGAFGLAPIAARAWRLRIEAPPGPLRPPMVALTSALVRRAIAAAVAELGRDLHAVVACNPLLDVLPKEAVCLRVFWAQDDFGAGASLFGQSAERLRDAELRQARSADVVVAANPEVAEHWRRLGFDTRLIPYGCDADLFAGTDSISPAPEIRIQPPVAGFVGYLGDRIDLALLEGVARAGHSLLLVGPRHPAFEMARLDALLTLPNVQWVGGKRFEELPAYQAAIDVGLVPYTDSAFNRGSFPLKTLEYLAAGRPVVATDLPATRWLQTDLVRITTGTEAFVEAVTAELARPRTPSAIAARRAFGRRHSWDVRAREFAEALQLPMSNPNQELAS